MTTISDKLCKVGDGTGVYPNVATSTATRVVGGKALACDNLAGWAKDTPVHFSTYRLNADGTVNTETQTDWKGIVSDNIITQMTRVAGAADTGNNPGDKVELNPTVGWANDLVEEVEDLQNKFPLGPSNISLDLFQINPKFMQCGTGTVSVQKNNSTGGIATINFPTAFENQPNVVITPQVFEVCGVTMVITGPTKTGFGVTGRVNGVTDLGNRDFQWIAIDKTQPPLIAKQ